MYKSLTTESVVYLTRSISWNPTKSKLMKADMQQYSVSPMMLYFAVQTPGSSHINGREQVQVCNISWCFEI